MTDNLPNYLEIEPPSRKPIEEFTTHERRALLLRAVIDEGSPHAVNQSHFADQCGVHRSTISRDMNRLRESIDEHLGNDAKLTTRALFERVTDNLLEKEDWKAKKAAWDIVMDWNQWLADLGEQHRAPTRSELDVRSRHAEVAYRVVREGEDEPLPETDDGTVDYEELGFTSGPASVDVEAVEEVDHNG